MHRYCLTLGWLLWLSSPLGAVQAANVVTLNIPDPIVVQAGGSAVAGIGITVKPGYHVQANPVKNLSLIPIVLDIKPHKEVVPGKPLYPESKTLRLAGSDEDLVVYDGQFAIRLPVIVRPGAQPGEAVLAGTLRYQACDDEHCLFPVTLPLKLPVRISR